MRSPEAGFPSSRGRSAADSVDPADWRICNTLPSVVCGLDALVRGRGLRVPHSRKRSDLPQRNDPISNCPDVLEGEMSETFPDPVSGAFGHRSQTRFRRPCRSPDRSRRATVGTELNRAPYRFAAVQSDPNSQHPSGSMRHATASGTRPRPSSGDWRRNRREVV